MSNLGKANLYFTAIILMMIIKHMQIEAATFASILKLKSKLYIHEQNSRMGKLNQITSKFATEVFSSFDKNSLVLVFSVSSNI